MRKKIAIPRLAKGAQVDVNVYPTQGGPACLNEACMTYRYKTHVIITKNVITAPSFHPHLCLKVLAWVTGLRPVRGDKGTDGLSSSALDTEAFFDEKNLDFFGLESVREVEGVIKSSFSRASWGPPTTFT